MTPIKTHIPLYKKIIEVLSEIEVQPIIYGGVAFWYFTGKPEEYDFHDIDMLISEKLFDVFVASCSSHFPEIHIERTKWDDLIVTEGLGRIDLDSREKCLGNRDDSIIYQNIEGLQFPIINRQSLKDIYRESYEHMPENEYFRMARSKYQEKYLRL